MNNLEICKRIAEIEGISYIETRYKGNANFIALVSENDFTGTPPEMIGKYDPLTDDALCFKLMVKYKITVEFTRYYKHLKSTTIKAYYDDKANNGYGAYTRDINTNKAICLAIIEAHKPIDES